MLILSGLSRPQAKVKGLGLGADDFITKPFDKAELLARMQAIVRRSKGFSQPTLRVGPLQLNLDSREVTVDGQPVHLTGKEYAILELLVLRKGMVLTKEAFLNHLYGGMDEPEMKIIDVFICKLRKKLAQAGADNLIGTVWGRGYMIREPARRRARARPAHPRRLRAGGCLSLTSGTPSRHRFRLGDAPTPSPGPSRKGGEIPQGSAVSDGELFGYDPFRQAAVRVEQDGRR